MESGNDYVIQVKGNSPKLKKFLEQYITDNSYIDTNYTLERSRDREEQRAIYIYDLKSEIIPEWPSCNTLIYTNNSGNCKGKFYEKTHLYITSRKEESAEYYTSKIRDHWGIENCCHWVKDAIMYEDKGMVKGKKLSSKLSLLRSIVLNIYRLNKQKSIKAAIEKYSNKLQESCSLLLIKHISMLS